MLLLLGIGNQSRGDDGLGWALLDAVAPFCPPESILEYRYQLMVEDADLLQSFTRVLFIDASHEPAPAGAVLQPCYPLEESFISTHRLEPGGVLYLAKSLYGCEPEAYVLALQGYQWELGDELSEAARGNLEEGIRLVRAWMG